MRLALALLLVLCGLGAVGWALFVLLDLLGLLLLGGVVSTVIGATLIDIGDRRRA